MLLLLGILKVVTNVICLLLTINHGVSWYIVVHYQFTYKNLKNEDLTHSFASLKCGVGEINFISKIVLQTFEHLHIPKFVLLNTINYMAQYDDSPCH